MWKDLIIRHHSNNLTFDGLWIVSVLFYGNRILEINRLPCKAVVGGLAGPAMAGPLFMPEMVLAGPHFWPNIFLAGPFSHVSSRPSLMIYFSLIKF